MTNTNTSLYAHSFPLVIGPLVQPLTKLTAKSGNKTTSEAKTAIFRICQKTAVQPVTCRQSNLLA